jgi:hypothetical protein
MCSHLPLKYSHYQEKPCLAESKERSHWLWVRRKVSVKQSPKRFVEEGAKVVIADVLDEVGQATAERLRWHLCPHGHLRF